MHHAHSCAEGTPKRIAIARKLLFTMDLPCISAPKPQNLQVALFYVFVFAPMLQGQPVSKTTRMEHAPRSQLCGGHA